VTMLLRDFARIVEPVEEQRSSFACERSDERERVHAGPLER